jgi:predicted NAD/FAD-binding protein
MKVAVIGSGIAGLATARGIAQNHEVTLFEADDRLGGHTNTVTVTIDGKTVNVDTGFIVHNRRNYPLFCRFIDDLNVASQDADMSFSVSKSQPDFAFSGSSLNGLFAQRQNLFSLSFWKLVRSIVRFGKIGKATLVRADSLPDYEPPPTVAEFVKQHGFSQQFLENYLIPLGASIWSADPTTFLQFPTLALLSFFDNHGLLTFLKRPEWRTIVGGSQRYIDALVASTALDIRLGTPVHSVGRTNDGVLVTTSLGSEVFDEIIVATHSDQALSLLSDPSAPEREILGSIRFQHNETVLHTDRSMLPANRRAWAAWNYHVPNDSASHPTLTYWMNQLQGLETDRPLCVTLNRTEEINPADILGIYSYHHPIYDLAAFAAQSRWEEINGVNHTWYVGAWWGYGFHEDAMRSAQRVLDAFDTRS